MLSNRPQTSIVRFAQTLASSSEPFLFKMPLEFCEGVFELVVVWLCWIEVLGLENAGVEFAEQWEPVDCVHFVDESADDRFDVLDESIAVVELVGDEEALVLEIQHEIVVDESVGNAEADFFYFEEFADCVFIEVFHFVELEFLAIRHQWFFQVVVWRLGELFGPALVGRVEIDDGENDKGDAHDCFVIGSCLRRVKKSNSVFY
jgi:hypothetical protein